MLPPVVRAGSLPSTNRSDCRRSLPKIGAAAATVAAIAGAAVVASAGPSFAATTRPSAEAAPVPASGRGGPAADSPSAVLAAPAHGGSWPLAARALDDATRGNSAPLAKPATGMTGSGSPLAATGPAPASPPHRQPARPAAPPRRQPARPSASPAGHPAAPRPQQAAARPTASTSPAPSKPYEFYDSVEPETVPAGAIVGTYSTGARPVPAAAVAGRKQVLWIDTLATDPAGSGALDVEPGCATPSQVPGWVSARLKAHPGQVAIVYMSLSEWPQVQADVAALPTWMRSRIRWWVADPTGVPHIVPGSSATQWYWGSTYDESMAAPNFNPDLVPGPSSP